MPDQRSVMKEFRSLEQKRATQGLTPAEEARHAQLRELIGPEVGAGGLSGGFDVNAAAARLRDSLLPAGLRNRPSPPTEAPPAPEPAPEPALSAADVLAGAYESQPFEPLPSGLSEDALFDASTFEQEPADAGAPAPEGAWDAAPAYDPAAGHGDAAEPGGATAGDAAAWDPNAQADAAAEPTYGEWAQPTGEAGYDPAAAPQDAQGWDASQTYDPSAGDAAPYDPNAPEATPYDPNAPAVAYDPDAAAATWDPSAQGLDAGPGWDSSAPLDPSAPPTWDANQPFDPSAAWAPPDAGAAPQDLAAPAWDPNAPFDPSAPPAWESNPPYGASAAYDAGAPGEAAPYEPAAAPTDPAQAWDPNAEPGWSPDAQAGWSPDAATPEQDGLEAGVPFGEPEPEPAFALPADSSALLPPEGWELAAPGPDAPVGAQLGEYDETGGAVAAVGEDAGLESMLPFEPAAETAEAAAGEGGPPTLGEYDDTAGFSGGAFPDASPADLPAEGSGFEAARAVAPDASEGWHPEPAVDEGFLLESGGSFDAAHAAAAPEWSLPGQAPWESPGAPETGASEAAAAPAWAGEPTFTPGDSPAPADDAPFAEPAFAEPDALLEVPADALAVEGAAATAAPESDLPTFDVDVSDAFAAPPGLAGTDAGAAEIGAASGDLALEPEPAADLSGPAPALDFSRPDLSEGQPEEDFAGLPGAAAAPPVVEEDIPTIDGEEIVEEAPPEGVGPALAQPLESALLPVAPPEAAPAEPEPEPIPPPPAPALVPPPPPAIVVPPPPPAPPAVAEPRPAPVPAPPAERVVGGVHRVVVHTVEGQVRRGVLEDADLAAAALGLCAQAGAAPEPVATEKVKAIFFMLSPGEKPPAPEGKKVRVTFRDGRQIAGFSPDYDETGPGFFMVPGDTRTNTGRIWVYRASVKQVSVS